MKSKDQKEIEKCLQAKIRQHIRREKKRQRDVRTMTDEDFRKKLNLNLN